MKTATVDRQGKQLREDIKTFAELMEEVKNLEPQQQEKLTFFVQGYVAAAAGLNKRDKAAI